MELNIEQLKGLIQIFKELDTDKILKQAVEKISQTLNAKGCSIFIYDKATNAIVLAQTTAGMPLYPVIYREGEGLTGWVFKHKKPLVLQNLEQKSEDDLREVFGHDIYRSGKFVEGKSALSKSFIAVPITSKSNKFYGVIRSSSVDSNFTDRDLELLIHIAGYISIAMENSELYRQEQKKADYFKFLMEFGTKLHTHYNLTDLFDFVGEQAARTFSAETSEIYIRSQDDPNTLILRAGYGVPLELINSASHQIGEGLTGTIVLENRTIRLNNVLTFPKYKGKYRNRMKQNLKYGDRLAFLGIPVAIKSHAIGCIKLYNKIPKTPGAESYFTEDDEKYLSILGDMLSVAIENHQYRESMQNSALQMIKSQRLTALGTMAIRLPNEITNSLTTAQIGVQNLIKKLNKPIPTLTAEEIKLKLQKIANNMKEVSAGVGVLQEFSTKAGFSKMRKTWLELIDEGLLFLTHEILHKKINIHQNKHAVDLPLVTVEPNEMIEVIINLLIIAISAVKHYEADLFIKTSYTENNKTIYTTFRSVDNPAVALLENQPTQAFDDGDIVTPQKFMLGVSKEIITSNYNGKIIVNPNHDGIFIELALPIGG